ncbi:peptidase [Limnobaculum zhutongyuii]|uniref:Peptidase n=1 Tax=Limnobaculum zhutongyuii TaxID=2498113 RepID=A0A411WR56_9GAMM|nr:peptidase [Limnobaculum zhutongyuii]TQS89516.1 peptidase [Limnobaculum zhutongyuii]
MLLASCGISQDGAAPPYTPLPANLTAPILPPQPGSEPGALTWGESLELNVVLYGVITRVNCERALIRQIEKQRQDPAADRSVVLPVECEE